MKIDKEMQAMWTSKTTKIYRYINQIRICIVILDPCHTNKNEGLLNVCVFIRLIFIQLKHFIRLDQFFISTKLQKQIVCSFYTMLFTLLDYKNKPCN